MTVAPSQIALSRRELLKAGLALSAVGLARAARGASPSPPSAAAAPPPASVTPSPATRQSSDFSDTMDLPARGLCAHRGAMDTHPENTVPAFQEAIRAGAHMIELDVQPSADGVLVLMHDDTVDRTTDGRGAVRALSWESLRKLDAGVRKNPRFAGTRIPSFEEALALMPRNVWLNCHLKGGAQAASLAARLILEAGREKQAFLAADKKQTEAARAVSKDLLICNMERQKDTVLYVRQTIESGAQFIQLRAKVDLPRAELARLAAAGVRINCFPSGPLPPALLREWLAQGVHFPLVNDIAASMSAIAASDIRPVVPRF